MGAAVGAIGAGTLGAVGLGKGKEVGNILFGKKSKPIPEDEFVSEIRNQQRQALRSQLEGLGNLKEAQKVDPTQQVTAQVARERAALRGGADDARRITRDTIAQRGLQGSSIGFGQQRAITQRFGEQSATLQASIPERVQNIRLQRAQALINASTGILRSQDLPIRFQGTPGGKRGGGLFNVLATGAGAAIGGLAGGGQGVAGGAQAGSSIGQGVTGLFGS
jgi:hypothetical protein